MQRRAPTVSQCPKPNECGQCWEQLDPIRGETDLRFCLRCQRAVHRCANEAEAAAHRARGRCVLVESDAVTPADIHPTIAAQPDVPQGVVLRFAAWK